MPHVIVKLWPGKSEAQKKRLAEAVTKDVMSVLHYGDESVSVAFEEIRAQDWLTQIRKYRVLERFRSMPPFFGGTAASTGAALTAPFPNLL